MISNLLYNFDYGRVGVSQGEISPQKLHWTSQNLNFSDTSNFNVNILHEQSISEFSM
jgi:hypothetical protein